MEEHVHDDSRSSRKPFRLPFWLGCIAFVGIGLFFLLSEHRAHTLGAMPYVLLLLCPALHRAQAEGRLADTGPYARVRHPQHLAFLAVMVGFLLQWPTLPTVVMFPILAVVYVRLARREGRESAARFGHAWIQYARATRGWVPRLRRASSVSLGAPT